MRKWAAISSILGFFCFGAATETFQLPAQAFNFTPNQVAQNATNLQSVTLSNLNSNTAGSTLNGNLVNIFNCCLYTKCIDGSNSCTSAEQACADPSDSTVQPQISFKLFHIPASFLQPYYAFPIPYDIYVNANYCTRIASTRSQVKNGQLGFFETPIDGYIYQAVTNDNFSEVQTYYSATAFLNYILALAPTGRIPQGAFPLNVYVNQVAPALLFPPDTLRQALQAGNGTQAKPLTAYKTVRIDNAEFVEAVPDGLEAETLDDIATDSRQPFNAIYLYQGDDRDNSLDGEVVMHEVMHYITHLLAPELGYKELDAEGLDTQPQAMAEAWSDYFAASFSASAGGTNPMINGSYMYQDPSDEPSNEGGGRDISRPASCPTGSVGEVHIDSAPFSYALWQARTIIYNQLNSEGTLAWDRALLLALSQANADDNFSIQTQKILAQLDAIPEYSQTLIASIKGVFNHANLLRCARIVPLVDNQYAMYLDAPDFHGLTNFSPPPFQLEISVPAGMNTVTLDWEEEFYGTGFIFPHPYIFPTDANSKPLRVLVNPDSPIVWNYAGSEAIPSNDGQFIRINPANKATYEGNNIWRAVVQLGQASTQPRQFYISLLTADNAYVLHDIKLSLAHTPASSENTMNCSSFGGESATGDGLLLLALLLLLSAHCRMAKARQKPIS